jgi:GAF domain-containing protein
VDALLGRIVNHLPEPLLVVTGNGLVLLANDAARALARRLGSRADLAGLLGAAAPVFLERARQNGDLLLPLPVDGGVERIHRVVGRAAGPVLVVWFEDATREISVQEQLMARTHELEVLRDVGAAMTGEHDVLALLHLVYLQTSRLLNTGDFIACFHDPRTSTLHVPMGMRSWAPVTPGVRECSNGPVEHVIATRRALSLGNDPEGECRALGLDPHEPLGRSWLGVPLVAGDEAFGAIVVQDFERPGRFTEHDVSVLSVIAAQASTAIRNARLLAEARHAVAELSEAQTKLLESERLRTVHETVGTLSHEINNPLATISGNAQLLLRGEGLDPALRDKLRRIYVASQRIESVTTRMSNLIQTASMPYPGDTTILDLSHSRALGEPPPAPPGREAA